MLDISNREPSQLGRVFLRNVLKNMRHVDGAKVCFGLLGEWYIPNYQVIFPNNQILTFRGQNHKRFGKEKFEATHLSQNFTLAKIRTAFDQALSNQQGSACES